MAYLTDHSESCFAGPDSAKRAATIKFERVPIQQGLGYDQTWATNNLVGLKVGNVYLRAYADGRVILDSPHCYGWEHFRLIADWKTKLEGRAATC
jgi:hypothetical protein